MVLEYLTAILVVVTAVYAYLTNKMAQSAEASVQAVRDQSEAMLRPYVIITPFIRPHTPFLYLRVENAGRTGAANLKLSIDCDFFQFGEADKPEKNLRTKSAFVDPIDTLPPGSELLFALAQSWTIFGENARSDITPLRFNVLATYQFGEKTISEVNRIDLRPYLGSEGMRDPVVEELERLRQSLERKK